MVAVALPSDMTRLLTLACLLDEASSDDVLNGSSPLRKSHQSVFRPLNDRKRKSLETKRQKNKVTKVLILITMLQAASALLEFDANSYDFLLSKHPDCR